MHILRRLQATWWAAHPMNLSLASSLAIQSLNVLGGVALARALGPIDRGALAAVVLWPSILALVGSLGISDALTYHTARRTRPAGVLLLTGATVAVLESAFMIVLGMFLLPIVLGRQSPEARGAGEIFLTFIPLNLLTLVFMSVLNGLQSFARFQICRVLVVAVTAGSLLTLAVTRNLSLTSAVLAYIFANAITVVVAAGFALDAARTERTISFDLARILLRYGLQNHIGTISSTLNERLDQLVISVLIAPAQLGLYVVAVTLSSPMSLVGSSIGLVTLPYVAYSVESVRRETARMLISTTFMLSGLVAIPLVLFTSQLVRLIFGSDYEGAADVARVLMAAGVILSTGRVIEATLRAIGRPLEVGAGELIALVATIAGLGVLLPSVGILGAATASLIAYAVSAAWMLRRCGVALGIRSLDLVFPRRADIRHLLVVAGLAR